MTHTFRFAACLVALSLAVATARADERALVRAQRDGIAARAPGPQLSQHRTATFDGGGPFAPTSHPSLDGSPVEALILTSETMLPAFSRLAAWKTAKGVPTVVRTLAQVQSSGLEGSDLAETMRHYIRAAYQDWGVRFVLLGGDTDVVPSRYVATEFLGLSDPLTDLYFACLDRDWNADRDANYGEASVSMTDPGDDADLVSEVALGRAPVSTLAEADLFVDKTLAYERPMTIDFQDKFLLLAEVLFPSDYSPGDPISHNGATFAEALLGVLPPTLRIDRLYETPADYPGSQQLSRATARTAVNAGYGTVVHIGHGYRYTLSVADGSLDVGDAAAFTNLPRCGLFYMLNCTAAAFDFESIAEKLLLNPQGGAALVIGASREAFPLPAAEYQEAFFRHVYGMGERQVGVALANSRAEFLGTAHLNSVDRWTQLTYTLLGDPETPLWTAVPRALTLAAPSTVTVGAQDLVVTVTRAGAAVPGARVCAATPTDAYAVATTNAAGQVTLRIEPRATGTLTITASAADHVPVQTTRSITVPSMAARALVLAGPGLDDDGGTSGFGNQDGRLDAGETVRLTLPLRNAGTTMAAAIASATLTTSDPDVQIAQGASTYPAIAGGAQADATTPFQIQVLVTTPDSRVVTLRLQFGAESRTVELLVHAARPRLASLRWVDRDGDGTQEPNEEIDLYYTVVNSGSGTAEQLALELVALEPGLQVLAGNATLAPLAPGASAENATPLTVQEASLAQPNRARLVLRHRQNSNGDARRIDLRPPVAPAGPEFLATDQIDAVHVEWPASMDPDLLGYRVERAASAGGPFVRVDAGLLRTPYLRDTGLAPSTRYLYRVVAVDSAFQVSAPGPAAEVSTNPPRAAGWPLTVDDRSASSPAVADVDGDGDLDVVGAAQQIYAWDGHGIELRDSDQSPITWGLFYGNGAGYGSITLADLDPAPGKEIVATTWHETQREVVVVRRDGTLLPGWPRPLVAAAASFRGSQVAPVVANLDAQGGPEILVAGRDGRLYGWHADGSEIVDGDADPTTSGVFFDTGSPFLRAGPAVADLDPLRPGLEIVVGGTDARLHVLGANGAALAGWPRTYDGFFGSGASIGDLDGDGRLEIAVLEASGALHALHVDGSEQAGFPVLGFRAFGIVPSPALGNLVGDSGLEIVAVGSDGKVRIVDANGADRFPGAVEAGAETESSPILGDVDGDAGIEIVLGDEQGVLHAWNADGSQVSGFPISLRGEVRGTPALADVDGDGDADLVTQSWDGVLNVWDLGVPWNPARFPWPTYRGDVHRTGLYGYAVPTAVALRDLAAAFVPGSGVHLSWHATADPGDDPAWRVYRAGPFQTEPLGSRADIVYTGNLIGERRGTGALEFVDADVEPGAWYVYVLAWRAGPGEAEVVATPITVVTAAASNRLRFLPEGANPMRPGTALRFEIPARLGAVLADVQLTVYDARGRRVRRLVQARLAAGVHTTVWDGRDDVGARVASGVYVAHIEAGAQGATRKLAWLR